MSRLWAGFLQVALLLTATAANALQPTVIASGLPGPPYLMGVDGGYVYFRTSGSADLLYRIPKTSTNLTLTTLPPPIIQPIYDTGGINDIAFDATNMFIHIGGYTNGLVWRLPKDLSSGVTSLVNAVVPTLIGVIGTDFYFLSNTSQIAKISAAEANPNNWQNISTGTYFLRQKALDPASIFFTNYGFPAQIYRFDIATNAETLLANVPSEGNLFIDDTNVYLSPGYVGFGVLKVPKQGGQLTTLVSGANGAIGMAVGGGYVYYTENSTLWAIPSGGGTPIGLASPVDVHNIVYDNGTLYWGPIYGDTIYRLDVASLNAPHLMFPLIGYTADNAPINSVFDHSMRSQSSSNFVESTIAPYACDGRVIAYTGEVGLLKGWPKTVPSCKNQPGYPKPTAGGKSSSSDYFVVNGNYTGANTPALLNYDGHDGIDYRAPLHTQAIAAISGTVQYPLSIVGARDGRAYYTFHTLEIIPDNLSDYRVYYMHLSSHPLDFAAGETLTMADTNPPCPSSVTFPIPAGTHISAGCLVALTGQAGTCDKNKKCAPHLHLGVQRRIPLVDLGSARIRIESSMTCPDDSQRACIPIDPYGWTGAPTDCAKIGILNSDPASPLSDKALGDYYECDIGIPSNRLWQ